MRVTQVSRQTFVGIDLPGQELGLAQLPLALAVFFGLTGPQFVILIPRYLASFGEPSPQSHTGAGGTRDQPRPLIKDVASMRPTTSPARTTLALARSSAFQT